MSRKSTQDWLEKGLQILAREGLRALTIDQMALALGVTKGSFYHHFNNVRDFEGQLLTYWANQYLSTADSLPDDHLVLLPLLDTIMGKTFSPITEPEIAIRMWAHQDERAYQVVEQVDAVRRQFVLEVFRSTVENEEQAGLMADMLFTITIGSLTALPRISPERVLDLYSEFKRLYHL
jgi:AcrR family transcriptional regulator